MSEDRHPMDIMAEACEIDGDDPSGWEPEMHVEHKYGTLFMVDDRAEYEDIHGVEGSFYHIKPNLLFINKELGPQGNADDLLCLSFSVYSRFVYHSDETLRKALVEVSVELLNGGSSSIHEFDYMPVAEWDHWPDAIELKTWVVEKCNAFLTKWKFVHPVVIDDVQHTLHRADNEIDWNIKEA